MKMGNPKSLLTTNPYLKDPATYSKVLIRNVVSSSAIEGIEVIYDSENECFVSSEKH